MIKFLIILSSQLGIKVVEYQYNKTKEKKGKKKKIVISFHHKKRKEKNV